MEELFDIELNFKKHLESIWSNENYSNFKVIKRGFLSNKSIIRNAILFIGINPSYRTNNKQNSENINSFKLLSQKNNEYSPYYKPFEQISQKVKWKWSHLDLLYFQETSQKYVDELIKEYDNGIDFINEQLLISKMILENSQPRVIIVCNTQARRMLGHTAENNTWLGYNFKFDNTIGTYRIVSSDSKLQSVPIFFTSMLSGQRALDIGSKERLIWHLNKVLNKSFENGDK